MLVRQAKLEDAKTIAAIHVRSWQVAYQGIAPQAYLDSLSVERRERFWQQTLEQGTSDTWVVEEGSKVLGWIAAARSRDPDAGPFIGEIWAIYVDPSDWRRGIGRLLWREAERQLSTSGFSEVTLWVLKSNIPAIAFYEANGFVVEPWSEKAITLGGAELVEIRLRKTLGG